MFRFEINLIVASVSESCHAVVVDKRQLHAEAVRRLERMSFSRFIQLIKINIIIENAKSHCNRIIEAKTKRGRFLNL